jgi:16S rRNA (cytidine1402-2'-O)-methyltransferase
MPIVLVPTPIGNRADLSFRGLEVLRTADRIAAEDTRHTGRLLQYYALKRPLLSLHQHNEHQRVPALVAEVAASGETLAVVTDAGMPGISDPGYLLVREAVRQGVPLEVLPGPAAFLPALVASGLPCDRFAFEGFLPHKKGRQKRLNALATEERTLIFYESPYRLVRTLSDFILTFGPERPAAVARELTKVHEELRRGPLRELHAHYEAAGAKGECVVVVAGPDAPAPA